MGGDLKTLICPWVAFRVLAKSGICPRRRLRIPTRIPTRRAVFAIGGHTKQ